MNTNIKRIAIWSGWFRLSHLLIGLSTLVLLATGNLIQHSPLLALSALDIHYYSAGFFVAGLVVRVYLMFFGQPHERLAYLIPKASDVRGMLEMLRFYALLGKSRLPNWYAQNPFWKPIYLLIYILLFSQLVSGIVLTNGDFIFGYPPRPIHLFGSELLLIFSLLHIICVIWHDYKGAGSDVSAIINGVRTFTSDNDSSVNKASQPVKFTPMNEFKRTDSTKK
jgi:Ni/Fe-hydrogenase 1 B-type cytochrome subunit